MGEKTLLDIFREKMQAVELARTKGLELTGFEIAQAKDGRYQSVAIFNCAKEAQKHAE